MTVSFGVGERFSKNLKEHYADLGRNNRSISKVAGKWVGNMAYLVVRGLVLRPIAVALRSIRLVGSFFYCLAIRDFKSFKINFNLLVSSAQRILIGVNLLIGLTVSAFVAPLISDRLIHEVVYLMHEIDNYYDRLESFYAGEIVERPDDFGNRPERARLLRNDPPERVGVNVHSRDNRVKLALELLRQNQVDRQLNLDLEVREFTQYIENMPNVTREQKDNALHALIGLQERRGEEVFPPFLGPQSRWSISEQVFTGEEIIARIWLHTKGLSEEDQRTARHGMFMALVDSYEEIRGIVIRVCNPGKASRLVHAALQGYLNGVNLERTEVSVNQAVSVFLGNPEIQGIGNRDALIARGNAWLNDNPLVNRDLFIQQLNLYADNTFTDENLRPGRYGALEDR